MVKNIEWAYWYTNIQNISSGTFSLGVANGPPFALPSRQHQQIQVTISNCITTPAAATCTICLCRNAHCRWCSISRNKLHGVAVQGVHVESDQRDFHKSDEWWGSGMVICLKRGADLHMVQLMPLTLSLLLQ